MEQLRKELLKIEEKNNPYEKWTEKEKQVFYDYMEILLNRGR